MKQELDPKVIIGAIVGVVVVVLLIVVLVGRSRQSADPQSPANLQAIHQNVQDMRAEFKQEMAARRAKRGQ